MSQQVNHHHNRVDDRLASPVENHPLSRQLNHHGNRQEDQLHNLRDNQRQSLQTSHLQDLLDSHLLLQQRLFKLLLN